MLLNGPVARLPQYLVFLDAILSRSDTVNLFSSAPANFEQDLISSQELAKAILAIQDVADNISFTLRNIKYRAMVLKVHTFLNNTGSYYTYLY